MRTYFERRLTGRDLHEDLQRARKYLQSSFEDVDGFLLPHPGLSVTGQEFNGSLTQVDERFLKLATVYCEELFGPEQLESSTFMGNPVTCRDLLLFAKLYAEIIQENGFQLPDLQTIAAAVDDKGNERLKRDALAKYKREMAKFDHSMLSLISFEKLKARHAQSQRKAMGVFESGAVVRYRLGINVAREEVRADIAKVYRESKDDRELHNVLCVLTGVAAFVISIVTRGRFSCR